MSVTVVRLFWKRCHKGVGCVFSRGGRRPAGLGGDIFETTRPLVWALPQEFSSDRRFRIARSRYGIFVLMVLRFTRTEHISFNKKEEEDTTRIVWFAFETDVS
jgi:hypothetical protein